MYGLVNQAIQDYITNDVGTEAWTRIRTAAGFHESEFVPLHTYPDALTFQLVGAACEVTGRQAGELVEAIGAYWVEFTAQKGYGSLLDQLGPGFADALAQLDAMHVRVALMMPQLEPPSFRVSARRERGLTLAYTSRRSGLAPLVVGLVKGLGRKFGLEPTVQLTVPRAEGSHTDVFEVSW
jgi:hypothetical protein